MIGAGTLMNPSISVIMDGVYANEFSGHVGDPGGFDMGHSHDHGHGHDHGLEDGFQLRETEFAFEATVDPYFDAFAMLVIEDTDHVDLEEAYFTTRSLPWGLQIKGGRFLSDVGYINAFHPHDWDFVDRPLANEHIFGDHGLQEIGLQLNWVAPTTSYLKLGFELLEGETSGIANYEGSERAEYNEQFMVFDHDDENVDEGHGKICPKSDGDGDDDGDCKPSRVRFNKDLPFSDSKGPRLATFFAKWGPDLGFDHAAQFGISGGYASAYQRHEEHSSPRHEAWDGDAWFAGLDAVYKYTPPRSYQGAGQFTLQGEYFYRQQDLTFQNITFDDDNHADTETDDWAWTVDDEQDVTYKQDGFYLQAIYGIAPRWRSGLRAEALGLASNTAFQNEDNPEDDFGTSYRYSASVTHYPTEFSYIRGQVNYSDFASDDPNGSSEDSWQFLVQYNLSLGVHGAHPF
ncbi:zinc-regulated TonB-dependent outer membrane receptor [Halorhodospira halochloris]|uniref:zinc-regulated TonB-dependent outer membrane receptor n=1 Tax=Halorhodospira halochloris TaxID=1052 RepID=UPI003B75CFE7